MQKSFAFPLVFCFCLFRLYFYILFLYYKVGFHWEAKWNMNEQMNERMNEQINGQSLRTEYLDQSMNAHQFWAFGRDIKLTIASDTEDDNCITEVPG